MGAQEWETAGVTDACDPTGRRGSAGAVAVRLRPEAPDALARRDRVRRQDRGAGVRRQKRLETAPLSQPERCRAFLRRGIEAERGPVGNGRAAVRVRREGME